MKKTQGLLPALMLLSAFAFGQTVTTDIKPKTIGVHFFFDDYKTAANIRSSSLNSTLQNKMFAKIKDMSAGLAVNYMKGLARHFDFSTTAAGSFVTYDIPNRPNSGTERFLLEVDASVITKLVTDKYWFTPYISLGLGAAKYGGYYSGFIPAGIGFQVNFFDEAYLLLNSQYRIPVTENASYHFYYSIGIAGNIGKK